MAAKKSKIVLVGEKHVGKTSLVLRFCKDTFSENMNTTIGAAFLSKYVEVDDVLVNLLIWDTAGEERFRKMIPLYYNGSKGAIVVYDVTQEASFQLAKNWVNELYSNLGPDFPIVLACNKIDQQELQQVPSSVARAYAREVNVILIETSAKENIGVVDAFYSLARECVKRIEEEDLSLSDSTEGETDFRDQGGSCCKCAII